MITGIQIVGHAVTADTLEQAQNFASKFAQKHPQLRGLLVQADKGWSGHTGRYAIFAQCDQVMEPSPHFPSTPVYPVLARELIAE